MQAIEIDANNVAPTYDRESAIVATLAPGSYTAAVSGKNGGTGVGLVEVYDLNQSADSKLANISTRGVVQSADNVLIGGFILGGGNANAKVLVRAIGSSLANLGVTNSLSDPTLELRDGNGVLLHSNDNWKDQQRTDIRSHQDCPRPGLRVRHHRRPAARSLHYHRRRQRLDRSRIDRDLQSASR